MPKPPEPPKPQLITIALRSKPAGAKVFLGTQALGTTPTTMSIVLSSELVSLTARFSDGIEVVQTIVPDREIPELVFEKKAAKKVTVKSVGKTPTKPTTPTTPTKPTKPEDRDSTLDPFKR